MTWPGLADDPGEFRREVAGAPGDVEDAVPGTHAGELDSEALPEPVDTAGHQVVHEVVARGHGVEDSGDQAGLLVLVHLAVAEVGRVPIFHSAPFLVSRSR